MVFSRKIIAGFCRCCARRVSTSSGKKSVSQKRGFGSPVVRYVFHHPQVSVLGFSFVCKIHDRADQKLFWRVQKFFGRARSLVRSPPPIRFAPLHIMAPHKIPLPKQFGPPTSYLRLLSLSTPPLAGLFSSPSPPLFPDLRTTSFSQGKVANLQRLVVRRVTGGGRRHPLKMAHEGSGIFRGRGGRRGGFHTPVRVTMFGRQWWCDTPAPSCACDITSFVKGRPQSAQRLRDSTVLQWRRAGCRASPYRHPGCHADVVPPG